MMHDLHTQASGFGSRAQPWLPASSTHAPAVQQQPRAVAVRHIPPLQRQPRRLGCRHEKGSKKRAHQVAADELVGHQALECRPTAAQHRQQLNGGLCGGRRVREGPVLCNYATPEGARWHLMGAQRHEQAVAFLVSQPRPCADAFRPSPLSGLCWQNKGGGPQC